jgi:HD-GYP domain-containing protein (c-di-GMP phosphodiesterase class II)
MDKFRDGKPLNLNEIKNAAAKMVDSITRNPDAMVWVCRIKDKDTHTYHHSIRASVWAIAYGRHLGLSKDHLQTLAISVLLCKVGKTKLPGELLDATSLLTSDDVKLMKKHVDFGVEILRETPGISEEIISIVWCHNERHDGSGYPRQLKGDQIPFLAKIAGIVDYYETLINPRPDIEPLTSSRAMARLHDKRGSLFQTEIVEEFIQAIGIYPTGTIVQLSSGEIGVITEQNPERKLRPVVTLVLDEYKKPLRIHRIINLLKQTTDKHGKRLDINKSLPQGAYDIDPAKIYLSTLGRFLGLSGLAFKG